MERFKKGQLIPKRLGIVQIKSKLRHLVTFGCDVEVTGKMITATSVGPCICMSRSYVGGTRGKPRIYSRAYFNGIHVNGFRGDNESIAYAVNVDIRA